MRCITCRAKRREGHSLSSLNRHFRQFQVVQIHIATLKILMPVMPRDLCHTAPQPVPRPVANATSRAVGHSQRLLLERRHRMEGGRLFARIFSSHLEVSPSRDESESCEYMVLSILVERDRRHGEAEL
jgi:hypothetical protein